MAGLNRGEILCCLIAGLLASQSVSAAEPSRSAKTKQREAVEAILAKPAEWTPPNPQSITIDGFIAHVREKHGLAIRWDTSSVGLTTACSEMLGGLSTAARSAVTVYNASAPSPYVQSYSTVVPTRLQKHVTNFAPPTEPLPPAIPEGLQPTPPIADPNVKLGAPPEKLAPIVVDLQPAPISAETPKPRPATAPDAPEDDDDEAPHRVLSARPISPSAVALTGASVGETLQQLLDAAAPPIVDTGESLGMPLSIRALTLDYIIEGRSIVITTRLRANAVKETRVYRIANLKGMPPEQVAKVICHSIRPWSWRSQASEIADRLAARFPRGGSFKLPQMSVANQSIPGSIVTFADALPQPIHQASSEAVDPVSTNMEIARSVADALESRGLSKHDIEVRYNAGICTLVGSVGSPEAGSQAEQAARSVAGVQTVVNKITCQGQPIAATPLQAASTASIGLSTPPSPLPQQPGEVSMEELAKFGQLLTGGALAAIETVVNTVEIVHYGDPPTGVMEVLPGVLVITQSQGAHREIAELLEELAAAGTP